MEEEIIRIQPYPEDIMWELNQRFTVIQFLGKVSQKSQREDIFDIHIEHVALYCSR